MLGGDLMIDWSKYDERLLDAIKHFASEWLELDDKELLNRIDELLEIMEKYDMKHFDECFKYDFFSKDEQLRKTFFTNGVYYDCCLNSHNNLPNDTDVFRNKWNTYKRFKDFYKRDVLYINGFEDYQSFVEFAKKNPCFIVKDTDGTMGANISRMVVKNDFDIKNCFFKLLQYGGCVCEKWIEQCKEFAQFNETSVNTIRVATVYDERGLTKMYGMLRTGRNGNIVDNASIGGIAAEIDLDTGVVVSDGYTKTHLEHFEYHPDSGVRFKGFQIPRWDEVMPMIKEMYKLVPYLRVVGWDLALTNDGWVLIEGNTRPNIDTIQIIHYNTFGKGLYDEIENAIGRYRP